MFNRLERIANEAEPRTPILRFKITEALQPRNFGVNDEKVCVGWGRAASFVEFMIVNPAPVIWLLVVLGAIFRPAPVYHVQG